MAIVDARTRNLSRSTVQGLDFDLAYAKLLADGSINLSIGGTRLFTIDNRITDTAPRNNVAGKLGAPDKLRFRGRAGLILGDFRSEEHTSELLALMRIPYAAYFF